MINDGFLLFRNLGGARGFEDDSLRTGLSMGTRPFTGWGLGMYDFDNDGWKDLFFAMAHFTQLGRYLGREAVLPNRVFRNLDGRHFEDVSADAGTDFQQASLYRGVAFADFDNDGRVDAVVTSLNGPAKLFRNITSGTSHWIALKLGEGTHANRMGLGAVRVSIQLGPSGRKLYNHATTTVGYARFERGPGSVRSWFTMKRLSGLVSGGQAAGCRK